MLSAKRKGGGGICPPIGFMFVQNKFYCSVENDCIIRIDKIIDSEHLEITVKRKKLLYSDVCRYYFDIYKFAWVVVVPSPEKNYWFTISERSIIPGLSIVF